MDDPYYHYLIRYANLTNNIQVPIKTQPTPIIEYPNHFHYSNFISQEK